MVALDQESAVLHQKGLVKMLLSTPKTLMDELGPLIGVIKLYVMVSFPISFKSLTNITGQCFRIRVFLTRLRFGIACMSSLLVVTQFYETLCPAASSIKPEHFMKNEPLS